MSDGNKIVNFCAYCNHETVSDVDDMGPIQEHVMECPHHPMRKVEADLAEAIDALEDLRGWQNGPPLATRKWEEGWGNAMAKTDAVLEKHYREKGGES